MRKDFIDQITSTDSITLSSIKQVKGRILNNGKIVRIKLFTTQSFYASIIKAVT